MPVVPAKASPPNSTKAQEKPAKPVVKKEKKQPEPPPRTVIYEEVEAVCCVGEDAITVEQAKEMLGWQEEGEYKWGSNYAIMDANGRKIRLLNNITNRPIYNGVLKNLISEILLKHWVFNGEPIILGRTGLVLNGQHTLISIVLAEQERIKQHAHWSDPWPNAITIEKMVVRGVDESDQVVNTMDTCKPRNLADVIYRSHYFKKMGEGERQKASRIADTAIRFVWERTGVDAFPWAPGKTHAAFLDFLGRHERLLRCVKHIMEENKENAIGKFIGPGKATGLMYLMAACKTDGDEYRNLEPAPGEKKVDWEAWDDAIAYWSLFANGSPLVKEVRMALAELAGEEDDSTGTVIEKISILVKGWNAYQQHKEVGAKDVRLKYSTDEDGVKTLTELPVCGGIDLGKLKKSEAFDEEAAVPPMTPEQREAAKKEAEAARKQKAAELAERLKGMREEKAAAKVAAKPKRATRKDVEAAQTEKARKMDEEDGKL